MRIEKILALAFSFYCFMAVFTYGHAYRQFHGETLAKCEADKAADPRNTCYGDIDRFTAGIAALAWPYHWSEFAWGKVP